ncbi:stabilization protein [Pseudomonas sp. F1_0610]|uniref:FitA-like ribbon-helix-helix domain-containing protein n=1 Tax=Pseudomonas sp. F1_0610 TaxID=3114284 RepID=UPI0039C017FE
MANVLIRNLPAEVHRALKVRAALNERSTDAEIREILTAAVQPLELDEVGREVGLSKPEPAEKTRT